MASKLFISAKEVARELEVSDSFAYRLVRKLNDELEKQGFVVVKGKISGFYNTMGSCVIHLHSVSVDEAVGFATARRYHDE